jgi:hypothetical protein
LPQAVDHRLLWLVLVLVGALLLLFVNRAFHIDDPLFLWAAKQIQTHPADPYGFRVNWYGSDMAMFDVTKNPPLASYYLALVASIVGWSERALHLALMLPALSVVAGMFLLARRWCMNPALAVLAGLLTPVFLVSGVTVMCDVLMLAFFVWAVYAWTTGLAARSHAWMALAGALTAAAALTKYFGIALIPLLLVYALAKERRVGAWLLHFLIPIAVLIWYQSVTLHLYGRGLLLDAAAFAPSTTGPEKLSVAKTYVTLAFTGGCVATLVGLAGQLWSRKALLAALACAVVVMITTAALGAIGHYKLPAGSGASWLTAGQLALWSTAGVSLLVLAVLDLARRRDADALLLLLWTLGTFTFAGFLNWTTNGRSLLPLVVPAGLLMARRIEHRTAPGGSPWRSAAVPLAAVALLSVAVTWADSRLAETARAGAKAVLDAYPPKDRTVWFQGHWGFQYYMEALGAKALDIGKSHLTPGDLVILPTTNTNLYPPPANLTVTLGSIDIESSRWLSTMSLLTGAGFYADIFGPLPFALGSIPAERFIVVEIRPHAPDP